MNSPISLNIKKAMPFACEEDILKLKALVASAHDTVHSRSGEGQEFLGWLNLPEHYDRNEFERIKMASDKIKRDSKILVVIGIGGSYLGARAVIESLTHSFNNNLSYEKRKTPAIYFAGNNISSTYLANLIDIVKDEDFSINVISKSGTTTEPAIAFRVFKEMLENKYGKEEARKRIYVTTDKEKGALKKLADEEGYETFVIPDDIGGRFSVLTAVGLLPIASAGINIEELILGAGDAMKEYSSEDISENNCYRYAALRHILYTTGKTTEIMVSYEPCLQYFNEWWKQLFGESHGKNKRGIFPTSVNFSTDLHSMGQYIQDGLRNIFETIINIKNPKIDMMLKEEKENIDGLNFLSGKTVDYVNKKAMEGTALAHNEGGVPNIVITMEELTPYNIGYLIYFFEKACAIGGYLLGINPFDQEGVEAYKRNMFALLGKPGYEHMKEDLEKRLED